MLDVIHLFYCDSLGTPRFPTGITTAMTLYNANIDPSTVYVIGVKAINAAGLATTATTQVAPAN